MSCNKPCDSTCFTCWPANNLLACTQCWLNYFRLEPSSPLCTPCQWTCRTCDNSFTCLTCREGRYLDTNDTNTCLDCNPTCRLCVNGETCTACHNGWYLNNGPGKDHLCKNCNSTCALCTSATVCTACRLGYYMHPDSTCQVCDIANGWRISGTLCQRCQGECLVCPTESNICETCKPNFANIGGICTPCGDPLAPGFFISGVDSSQTCLACPGCKGCTDALTCTSCPQGKRLAISTNECVQAECGFDCRECFPDTPLKCTVCFDENKCVDSQGACNSCPPADFTPGPDASLLDLAQLTFNLDQISNSNPLGFKLVFSKNPIIFISPETQLTITNSLEVSSIFTI